MQWPVPCAPPCKMCIVHSADVSSERSTKTKQRTVHNTTQMPVIAASPYRLLKAILSTSGHQNTKLMTAFDWQGLFCSLAILDPRVGHTMDVLSPFISVLCHSDSSTGSPVHVSMLSTQAVRGLPRLRAPGIVPCIISFSRQLPWFGLSRV